MSKKKAKPRLLWWQRTSVELSSRYRMLLSIVLGIVAFVLYAPSLHYDYTFDDDVYTRQNEVTQQGLERTADIFRKGSVYGFDGENRGTWRPVTLLTFALEKQRGKDFDPRRSHLFNLLLYALTAFLLFQLLTRMLPDRPWLLSLFIALLFVVHPVHIEVVANVKGREEILALLFLLLSLWSLSRKSLGRPWLWTSLGGLSYIFAILSKENAYSFVPLFPLYLYLFTAQRGRKLWIPTGIFFAIAISLYWVRLQVLDPVVPGSGVSDSFINNFVLAAEGFGNQLATILLILGKYLLLLVFPHPLRFDYSYAQFPTGNWADPLVWTSLLAYAGIAFAGLYLFRKKSRLAWGILFYLITIFAVAVSPLLLQDVAALGERFLFTPSLGFCMILGMGLYAWLGCQEKHRNLPYLYFGLGLLVILGIVKTIDHLPVWQNNETLFRYGVRASPESFRTHLNLAEILRARAEKSAPGTTERHTLFEEAQEAYQHSLSIYDGEGTTWYNSGICLMNLGQPEQASEAFQRAINMGKQVGLAANNIGVINFRNNNLTEAGRYFRMAIEAESQNADYQVNLGLVLENSGQVTEAVQYYQRALQFDPDHTVARKRLGMLGY